MAKRDTAVSESAEQRIGPELKRLREQAGLSLRTLAERAGFSASFISQLENGQVSPSIASLEHIATVLGVSLVSFFTAPTQASPRLVRADDRPSFRSSWSKARISVLTPLDAPHAMEALVVTVEPGGASGKQSAGLGSEQLVFVFDGSIDLTMSDETISLERGDAAIVPARTPHRWHNRTSRRAEILLVTPRLGR